MKKPKARFWATFAKFDDERTKIPLVDYVDKLCEFLATLFDDVSADDLLDNVELSEVQNIYRECSNYLWTLLGGKVEELEKNSETAEMAENI